MCKFAFTYIPYIYSRRWANAVYRMRRYLIIHINNIKSYSKIEHSILWLPTDLPLGSNRFESWLIVGEKSKVRESGKLFIDWFYLRPAGLRRIFMRPQHGESSCDPKNLHATPRIFMRPQESSCDPKNLHATPRIFVRRQYREWFFIVSKKYAAANAVSEKCFYFTWNNHYSLIFYILFLYLFRSFRCRKTQKF